MSTDSAQVEPERRKGIGRYAMEVALSEMHKFGYKHAVLDVERGNYPAQLLYLSMGFQTLRQGSLITRQL